MKSQPTLAITAILALTACTLSACGGAIGAGATVSCDDGYPANKVTQIVPYPPGGPTDITARKFAPLLGKKIGADVIVVNRDGGSGTIGVSEVMRAKPDGATIGFANSTSFAIQPLVNDDLPYSGISDVQPIGELNAPVSTLVVKGDSSIDNLDDLVEEAEANPGDLSVATPGERTSGELMFSAFAQAADIDATVVPYPGGGDAATAVLKGEADAALVAAGPIKGLVAAGDLKNLGIVSYLTDEYLGIGDLKDLQTREDAGYGEGLIYSQISFAPKKLPECAVDLLVEATQEVVTSDEWADFAADNYMPVSPKTPDEVTKDFKKQREQYQASLEDLG